MNPQDRDPLEKPVHELLRGLPHRPAPRTLESRVWSAIEASESLPWWRRGFADWPAAARAGFIGASTSLVAAWVLVLVLPGATGGFLAGLVPGGRFGAAMETAGALRVACEAMSGWVRPVWVHAGLAILMVNYAILLGLGAATWRTLRARN